MKLIPVSLEAARAEPLGAITEVEHLEKFVVLAIIVGLIAFSLEGVSIESVAVVAFIALGLLARGIERIFLSRKGKPPSLPESVIAWSWWLFRSLVGILGIVAAIGIAFAAVAMHVEGDRASILKLVGGVAVAVGFLLVALKVFFLGRTTIGGIRLDAKAHAEKRQRYGFWW